MGVEFFEENNTTPVVSAASQQRRGMAGVLIQAGLMRSVSGSQVLLLAVGVLSLFGAYLVYSLRADAGYRPPTDAEVRAMADLLKK